MPRVFVGRRRELEELRDALAGARAGRGALVILAGEPGIGKTRLASEAAAAATGMRVVWGRAWELGAAPAYWLWRQVVLALGGDAALLAHPESGGGEEARFRLFEEVVALLRRAAADEPLAIVLDDLHAVDLGSLLLLHHVVGQLPTVAIAIVATVREDELGDRPQLAAPLHRLRREGRVLTLARLERAEVIDLVRRSGADRAAGAAVFDVTQGNPLFIDELLRAGGVGGDLPASVREVIRQRLAPLHPETRLALEAVAVAGDDVRPGPLFPETALREAAARGVVEVVERDRYRLSHSLVREVLYRDLTAARREELHRQIGETLAGRGTGGGGSDAAIAHHLLAAGPGAIERAVPHAVRAAEEALEALAWEDALALLERTAAAAAEAGAGDRLRAEVLIALGAAQTRAGESRRGRATCRQAAELAERLGDPVLLARAALAYGTEPTVARVDPALVHMLEVALRGLPTADGALRARVSARLAAALQPAPDPSQPIALARDAIAMARRLGDERTLLETLAWATSAMMDFADPAERAPLDREAAALAAAHGDRALALRSHLRLIFDHLELGLVARIDDEIETVARLAAELRRPQFLWLAPMLRALRAVMSGRFDEAERHAAEARAVDGPAAAEIATCLAIHRLGVLRARATYDDAMAAIEELAAAVAGQPDGPVFHAAAAASLLAHAGRPDEARRHLERIPWDRLHEFHRGLAAFLAEAIATLGDATHAERVYDRLAPCRTQFMSWGRWGMICEGPYAHQLGLVAALLGRTDEAIAHLEDALAAVRGVGATPSVQHITRALDRLRAAEPGAEAPEPAVVASPAGVTVRLEREGELWRVSGVGAPFHLRDSRGLQILARLLEQADRDVHVLDLVGGSGPVDLGDAGEVLDDRARTAYRARLEDLEDDLAEAEANGDLGRAARARAEIEALTDELARAVGLGGRARRTPSAVERARTAVQRRIKDAIRRIAERDAALAAHLEWAVKTGTFCSYRPSGHRR